MLETPSANNPLEKDGETSCITLSPVVALKSRSSPSASSQIAKLLPVIEGTPNFRDLPTKAASHANGTISEPNGTVHEPAKPADKDLAAALKVSQHIAGLVEMLGLNGTLTERGVGKGETGIIVERALKGGPGGNVGAPVDEGWKGEVEGLVGGLF